jgi:CHAD domain-containing protein
MSKPHQARWDDRAGAAANARRELPRLAASYFARVRELLAEEPSPSKLHRLRLATKRLRYTLELFRPCYGPGLETRLAALRRVQQLLGEVNDSGAAGRLLSKSMSAASPQRARILRFLE